MKSLMSFLTLQNISNFKSFFNRINELRKVKYRTKDIRKRKVIVSDAALNYLMNR